MTKEDQAQPARRFPVLGGRDRTIRSVDWQAVEAARDQIEANHGQTPEQLAAVGGLDARELLAALRGERYSAALKRLSLAEVEGEIVALIGEAGEEE